MNSQNLKHLRAKELADLLSINPSTLWRWRQKNILPQPVEIGPNVVAWSHESIQQWLKEKANAKG
jgi:predicted DNA-binding transcriptional regulator AlpA